LDNENIIDHGSDLFDDAALDGSMKIYERGIT
jgi:hypothetical protein